MDNIILVTGGRGFIGRKLSFGKKFKGKLSNKAELFKQAIGVSGIVHLAAISDRRRCETDPVSCVESNLIGFCNVLETALKCGVWVIFVSSYQAGDPHLYGLTKLVGEELCRIYQRKGVRIKIIRLPIVYGPENYSDKVVTRFIKELQAGVTPKVDHGNSLYFVYVDDVAALIKYEVDMMDHKLGKPVKLRSLISGIRRCIREEKK